MLARNLLNSFIFTCCLTVGSMGAANTEGQQQQPENTADTASIKTEPVIVRLDCYDSKDDTLSTPLEFDKANRRARFALWEWSDTVHWDEELIVWADYSELQVGALFMFHRGKSMLQGTTISYEDDFPDRYTIEYKWPAKICIREF